MQALEIVEGHAPDRVGEAKRLFRAYADWLDQEHGIDLCFQNFDEEMAAMPGKYAPPAGGLYLARDMGGRVVGCVAFRPFEGDVCEMKRLWVTPEGRGLGTGRRLVEVVMQAAAARGYRRMILDTAGFMPAAQKLYEDAGFVDIERYYDNPIEAGIRYLGADLVPPERAG